MSCSMVMMIITMMIIMITSDKTTKSHEIHGVLLFFNRKKLFKIFSKPLTSELKCCILCKVILDYTKTGALLWLRN